MPARRSAKGGTRHSLGSFTVCTEHFNRTAIVSNIAEAVAKDSKCYGYPWCVFLFPVTGSLPLPKLSTGPGRCGTLCDQAPPGEASVRPIDTSEN